MRLFFYLIRSVFALIKRNALHQMIPGNLSNGNLFIDIMNYIHVNIQIPEKLRLSSLSKQFNLSPNHLSSLFKQQMGASIKKYIDDYKFKLIENRLRYSGLMLKEISNEFGFTDLSHLNKFMKNRIGVSPKDLRKNPGSDI